MPFMESFENEGIHETTKRKSRRRKVMLSSLRFGEAVA
jgi:hypothetical protein